MFCTFSSPIQPPPMRFDTIKNHKDLTPSNTSFFMFLLEILAMFDIFVNMGVDEMIDESTSLIA